jgi:hypothetical protein
LRPQSAVPSEAIAVVGPGSDPRVAPSLMRDASQPRQQQEAQIVEVGDRLGPDRGFYSRDVRCSTEPKRFNRKRQNWLHKELYYPSASIAQLPV